MSSTQVPHRPVRFLMIGGFLGAGKTTTIAAVAKALIARGDRVGVVTNDQGDGLVDTRTFEQQGLAVSEIAGACFCCRFDELTGVVEQLKDSQRPDVILGEPVGSCTDLRATVIHPLQKLYSDRVVTAPLAVLLDPHRARRILSKDPRGGFSPKAAYIYEKQIEEADLIVVNKIDTLATGVFDEVVSLVRDRFPAMPAFGISAREETGIDQLLGLLDRTDFAPRTAMDLDYDVYAEGEAELGWLNAVAMLGSNTGVDMDRVLRTVMSRVALELHSENIEPAHLKMIAVADGRHGIANMVRGDDAPQLSVSADYADARDIELTINARVFVEPEPLEDLVRRALAAACREMNLTWKLESIRSLKPGRPQPTHRLAAV